MPGSDAERCCETIFDFDQPYSAFGRLSSLCLVNFIITRDVPITGLRSLTIRDCLGSNRLLSQLESAALHVPPQLNHFELHYLARYGYAESRSSSLKFLLSFQGLQRLYLHLPDYSESEPVVRHHQSTLTELVYLQPTHSDGCFLPNIGPRTRHLGFHPATAAGSLGEDLLRRLNGLALDISLYAAVSLSSVSATMTLTPEEKPL